MLPDYRDRNLALGFRVGLIPPGASVVFVDDWVDTGGQLLAARAPADLAGPTGAAPPCSSTPSLTRGSVAMRA